MTDYSTRGVRRYVVLPFTAALMLAANFAYAKPPSAQSPATVAAIDTYQSCLAEQVAKLPDMATAQTPLNALGACEHQEAAVASAVLKENPDRPLFARSYAQSLKDEAMAQLAAPTALPVTVAMRARP